MILKSGYDDLRCRYGTKGHRRWGEWHELSEVTGATVEVDLEPELARHLITSQSTKNIWVDGYLQDQTFRPPFGFDQDHLRLSHLSGDSTPGSRNLCFHWRLEATRNVVDTA